MKRLLVSVLILSLCLWLVPAFAGEKIEIAHWQLTQKMKEGITEAKLANEFMRLHPNVKLTTEEVPGANMREKVVVALMSGETPNSVRDYIARLGAWWYNDALVSLDGVIAQEDLDDLYLDVLKGFTMDGKLIGYPTAFWLQAYAVNMTMLDKVGAAFPGDDFTLAEWKEIADKLKTAGYWATAHFAASEQGDCWMLMNLQMYGAKIWENGDYENTVINSPEGVKALKRLVALEAEGYAPKGTPGRAARLYLDMVDVGAMAMMATTPRSADLAYRQGILDKGQVKELQNIVITGTPHAEGIPLPSLPFGPSGVVIFKDEDPEKVRMSIEWLKFITSQENIAFDAIGSGQFCARMSVNPHAGNPVFDKQLELCTENGAYDLGISSPHYSKCRALFFPELQAVFMGDKTAQEALDDFAKGVAKLWKG